MTLGERIRARRCELNYTQDILASKAKISKGFLSDVENGKRSIGAETLLNISYALGCSLDFLMKGTIEDEEEQNLIEIPKNLAEFANNVGISFRNTLILLKMQRQIIAHKSFSKSDDDLDFFDWKKFYESVKEFL